MRLCYEDYPKLNDSSLPWTVQRTTEKRNRSEMRDKEFMQAIQVTPRKQQHAEAVLRLRGMP